MESERLEKLLEKLGQHFNGALKHVDRSFGGMVLTIDREKIHDVLHWLKNEDFNLLLDIAGVDGMHLGREERFELVYNLYSIPNGLRLRLKVFVPEGDMKLPTATDLWQSANWAEREAYDMFGFMFEGHPNLQRILCHREFEGHALRKDYPVMKGQWATGTSDLKVDIENE